MTRPLNEFAKIRNKYCVCYLGSCKEYILQLKYLRPHIEKQFSEIELHIICRDSFYDLLQDVKNVKPYSEADLKDYAYVKELLDDMKTHPVYEFCKESSIQIKFPTSDLKQNGLCFIQREGVLPTKSYNKTDIDDFVQKEGYKITNTFSNEVDCVAGVESLELYKTAFEGKKTILIPTGVGTEFYKNLFPNNIIFPIS